jgi:hypothetical protein
MTLLSYDKARGIAKAPASPSIEKLSFSTHSLFLYVRNTAYKFFRETLCSTFGYRRFAECKIVKK